MRRLTFFFLGVLIAIISTSVMAQGMRMSAEDRAKVLKDSLSLNDKQMEQVVVILKEMTANRQALADSIQDRDARREAMLGLMAKSDAKIESLLTPEQKTKYEAMKKQREARFRQRSN